MSMPIFALIAALAPAQTPDLPGPHAVSSASGYTFSLPNGDIQGDLFWPMDSNEPAPIVVIGHGFQRNARALAGWGSHLASHGMIVALPNFPGGFRPDHAGNGARMSAIIELLRNERGPITATPDPRKSAVMGHSAGGLAALFAAANDPTISLFVGLDPVDTRGGEGLAAVPSIAQPSLVMAGAPSLCNNQGSAGTLWTAFVAPQSWFMRVKDAAHFDAEDPSDRSIIVNGCGGSDETRRGLFRRYATAHLLAHFHCTGTDYLFAGRATADDVASGAILELAEVSPTQPCGASDDAGTTPLPEADAGVEIADAGSAEEDASVSAPDAGVADAGRPTPPRPPRGDASVPPSAQDAGAAGGNNPPGPDSGNAPPPADEPDVSEVAEEGCGCTTSGASNGTAVFGGLFVLVSLLGLGRRRRS